MTAKPKYIPSVLLYDSASLKYIQELVNASDPQLCGLCSAHQPASHQHHLPARHSSQVLIR